MDLGASSTITAPRPDAESRPDQSWLERVGGQRRFAVVVGLIGSIAAVVAARGHYPGIGNDATSYIAIADHVAAGRGLGYFLEPTLGLWPPGFPLVLSFFRWTLDINPQHTALVINALCPIAVALLTQSILRQLRVDHRLVAAGTVVATLGPATLSQMYTVQTEPTFIVLSLLTIWAVVRWSQTHRWAFLAVAAILQWFAFMDRYVGLVLIGSVALWLVFDRSESALAHRIRNAGGFFVGAVVVPAAWILRNEIVVGSPFGLRDTPLATYKTNAVDAATSMGQYIHGYSNYDLFTGVLRLLSLALLAACALGALELLRRAVRARAERGDDGKVGVRDLLGHPVGLMLIYAGAHWAYMIYSASTIAFDSVNTRYLVPVFVPSLMAALVLIDRGAIGLPASSPQRSDTFTKIVKAGVIAFVVVQLGVGAARVSASYWTDLAQRYNSATAVRVRQSPVFDQVPDDCKLYSNFPEFTYLAGIEAQRSPMITKFASPDRQRDLERMHREVDDDGKAVCLVWVNNDVSPVFVHQGYQHPLSTFERQFDLEKVAGDDDVTVYRVNPR